MRLSLYVLLTVVLIGLFTTDMYSAKNENASPQVFAPADVVVSCCYWFSLGGLDDPNDATFGRFVYGQSKIQKLKTVDKVCPAWCEYDRHTGYDPDSDLGVKACGFANRYYSPAHPGKMTALVWGTDGYVTNWTSAVTIEIDDRRKCGTGLIVRRFIIEDRGLKYYDDQHIWVVDCDPFYVGRECTDPDDDIEWPLNCVQPDVLDGCGADLSPENPLLGRPRVVNGADNQCNLIAIDFKDDTLVVEEDACLKVLRRWRVVDWCKYHPLSNPYRGKWEYLQVIKVRDKVDPEVTCQIGDCTPAISDSIYGCVGYIELLATGEDSCTEVEHLRFEYKIDLFNDGAGPLGKYDLQVGPLSKIDEIPVISENPFADAPLNVLDASGAYPIGQHRLQWFVEDGCGNVNLCDTLFTVKDCKAPTPYCKPGLITVVMPSTGSILVKASDLDDGSFDNCSSQLSFSFSSDKTDTTRTYDCDSLGERVVQVWVTDEEGNQDFCESKYIIQDGAGLCPGNLQNVAFSLIPETASGTRHAMADVELIIWKNGQIDQVKRISTQSWNLDLSGYSISDLIEVELRDLHQITSALPGKSMVTVQRHLLGYEPFDNYMSYWSADLDRDGEITTRDVSMIRKTLLFPPAMWPSNMVEEYVFVPIGVNDFDRNGYQRSMDKHIVDMTNLKSEYQFHPIKTGYPSF